MTKNTFKVFNTIFIIGAIFITPATALGAGGGGGGSVTSCASNLYTCNDWSSCSIDGVQTRKCTLTYICPIGGNVKPAESQSCTPPTPPPATAPAPAPTTQSPAPTATPAPSCTQSTWSCRSWSASCDISGQEHRSCHLVSDCPENPTSSPPTAQACSHLQCGNLKTLGERIACRVGLAPAGVARELQIQYLPEECRVINDNDEKKECIAHYKSYEPCWNLPKGEGRFECARNVLKLKPDLADEIKSCQTNSDQATCLSNLKEKVLYMIKFRFYDLEKRAEDLYYKGVSPLAIASFDTIIETKKQEFDQTKSTDDLKRIIFDVRLAWQNFLDQVKK